MAITLLTQPEMMIAVFSTCISLTLYNIDRSLHYDVFHQWAMTNLIVVFMEHSQAFEKIGMHLCVFSSVAYLILTSARTILILVLIGDRVACLVAPSYYRMMGRDALLIWSTFGWVFSIIYGMVFFPLLYGCYSSSRPACYCHTSLMCFEPPTQ